MDQIVVPGTPFLDKMIFAFIYSITFLFEQEKEFTDMKIFIEEKSC